MKLLHICNDFLGSKVHHNLYNNISKEQIVYYPTRAHTKNKQLPKVGDNITLVEGKQISTLYRAFFRLKVKALQKDLEKKIDISKVKIIHATTLYSDGVIAYRLFKKYRIPYVVSVRNTDVNLFMKLRPDLNFLIKKVLLNARSLIFISKSLHHNFFTTNFVKSISKRLESKSEIIYNGIDSFWLKNSYTKSYNYTPKNILFVGTFDKNKNVENLIKAVDLTIKKGYDLKLTLIGKPGSQLERIKENSRLYSFINLVGEVKTKEELIEYYRRNDVFAMISYRETFGLVFVEALSQGLPILYTESQGIDGVFKGRFQEAVSPNSISSISDGLIRLMTNFEIGFSMPELGDFNWENISGKFVKVLKK